MRDVVDASETRRQHSREARDTKNGLPRAFAITVVELFPAHIFKD